MNHTHAQNRSFLAAALLITLFVCVTNCSEESPINPINTPGVSVLPRVWSLEKEISEKQSVKRWHTFSFTNKTEASSSDPRFEPSLVVYKIELKHRDGEKNVSLVTGKCPKEAPKSPKKSGDRNYCVDGTSLPHKVKSGESFRFSLEATLERGWAGRYQMNIYYHNVVVPILRKGTEDHYTERGLLIYARGLATPVKTKK